MSFLCNGVTPWEHRVMYTLLPMEVQSEKKRQSEKWWRVEKSACSASSQSRATLALTYISTQPVNIFIQHHTVSTHPSVSFSKLLVGLFTGPSRFCKLNIYHERTNRVCGRGSLAGVNIGRAAARSDGRSIANGISPAFKTPLPIIFTEGLCFSAPSLLNI